MEFCLQVVELVRNRYLVCLCCDPTCSSSVSPCLRGKFGFCRLWELKAPPQIPCRVAAVWMPAFGQLFDLCRRRKFAFTVEPLDGRTHSQIAHREHVGAAQSKNQKHVCGPHAHTLDVSQGDDDLFIAQSGKLRKIHFAADCVFGEVTDVAGLLFGKATAPQFAHAQVLDGFRRELSAGSFFQSRINSPGYFPAQLLDNNASAQRFETRLTVCELARSYSGNDRCQDSIRFLKMVDGFSHGG